MTVFAGPPLEAEDGIGALTFGGFLDEVATRHGDRPAYVWSPPDRERVEWSYNELREQARAVAKALVAVGIGRGSRVVVLLGNRPEWVASVWGAAMAGGVAVPLTTFAEPRELDHLIRHADASVVLTQTALLRHRFVDELRLLCPALDADEPGRLRSPAFPLLRRVVALDTLGDEGGAVQAWDAFLEKGRDVDDKLLDDLQAEIVPSDDGLLIYSSGTTSTPKGVLHRHRGPLLQCWRHARRESFTPDDRIITGLPFFWTAGFAAALGASLGAGACVVTSSHFDADRSLDLIERERVTILQGPESQDVEMRAAQARRSRDLSSIRREAHRITADPAPEGWVRPVARAAYGSSESFTSITALEDSEPHELRRTWGRLTAGAAIQVVDPKTGVPLAVGDEGELCLKGPTMMRGYAKLAPEDAFDEDGWFHTGDLGVVDEDGLLHFAGRLTNMIKTKGANVAPLEVEQLLLAHPDIDRAVVVGVPDAVAGEVVVACVVPRAGVTLTEAAVQGHLSGELSSFKVPRHVFVFESADDLPRTSSDKFNVPAVRALAAQLLPAAP
jgi:fatty-acyl-CoA synthase